MANDADIAKIIAQEQGLVFDRFDEDIGFAVGSHAREAGKALGKGIGIRVQLWDRVVFYGGTVGASVANEHWTARKANTVRMLQRSSYRAMLERGDKAGLFGEGWGLDPAQYVLAGGGFPISIRGGGIIGAVVVSGLAERDDHMVSVNAVCDVLGKDRAAFALDPK